MARCAESVTVEMRQVLHVMCVFLALDIHHAMRMNHDAICGLYNIIQHYLMILEKKICIENKICIFNFVVCFLLGDSSASEFYKPTFRNTLSVPST